MESRVLYLFGSAAPPVFDIGRAAGDAQAAGWDVRVGLTPTAWEWLGEEDTEREQLTDRHPVRHLPRRPSEGEVWPPADGIVLAPATLNTVNSVALGLTTNFVTGVIAEAIGKSWPLVIMPSVNSAYATHPQFGRSVDTLRESGARVLFGPGGFEPNPPGQGRPELFPWGKALAAVTELVGAADAEP